MEYYFCFIHYIKHGALIGHHQDNKHFNGDTHENECQKPPNIPNSPCLLNCSGKTTNFSMLVKYNSINYFFLIRGN